MEKVYLFIGIAFGVFQIALMCKVWVMTNDIKDIRNKYISNVDRNHIFKTGDIVININTNEKMKIRSIKSNGKYACFSIAQNTFVGDFDASEINALN